MKKMMLGVAGALLVGASSASLAQGGPPKWTVGALGMAYYSPFEAERTGDDGDTKLHYQAVPYVSYRGERFYIEGPGLGYRFIKQTDAPVQFQFDVVASARMLPGDSRTKVTADAGLKLGVEGSFGFLNVTGLRDVTGTHDGYEVKATYGYSFSGEKYSFTPSVSAIWQDKNLSNHMWGVTQKQQDKMIKDDKPVLPVFALTESVVNFSADMVFTYRMTDSVSLIAFGSGTYLDKKVRANPGIDKKFEATLGLGVGYSF